MEREARPALELGTGRVGGGGGRSRGDPGKGEGPKSRMWEGRAGEMDVGNVRKNHLLSCGNLKSNSRSTSKLVIHSVAAGAME